MKLNFYSLLVASIGFVPCAFSQIDDSNTAFQYSEKNHIEHDQFLSAGLGVLNIDYLGSHLIMGVSGRLFFHDIPVKNLSVEFTGKYRYLEYDISRYKPLFVDSDDLNARLRRGSEFGASIYYKITSKKEPFTSMVKLKTQGRTDYVSELPSIKIVNNYIKLGFNHIDIPTILPFVLEPFGTFQPYTNPATGYVSSKSSGKVSFMQPTSLLSVGYTRRTFSNSFYNTNKYGEVNNSMHFEFSFELMYNIREFRPENMHYRFFEDLNKPNEPTANIIANQVDVDEMFDGFRNLPFGFRATALSSTLLPHGIETRLTAGVAPGWYPKDLSDNFFQITYLTIGFAYRFLYIKK